MKVNALCTTLNKYRIRAEVIDDKTFRINGIEHKVNGMILRSPMIAYRIGLKLSWLFEQLARDNGKKVEQEIAQRMVNDYHYYCRREQSERNRINKLRSKYARA